MEILSLLYDNDMFLSIFGSHSDIYKKNVEMYCLIQGSLKQAKWSIFFPTLVSMKSSYFHPMENF